MSLTETLSNGFVTAVGGLVDATGPTGTVTLATAALGGATWLFWRTANPYRGERTAPLVAPGAHVTTEILLDGAPTPLRIPAAPIPTIVPIVEPDRPPGGCPTCTTHLDDVRRLPRAKRVAVPPPDPHDCPLADVHEHLFGETAAAHDDTAGTVT